MSCVYVCVCVRACVRVRVCVCEQGVRDEAEAASQRWEVLDRDVQNLQNLLSPAARDLLSQRIDTQRDR